MSEKEKSNKFSGGGKTLRESLEKVVVLGVDRSCFNWWGNRIY